jgi:hypothetical protein
LCPKGEERLNIYQKIIKEIFPEHDPRHIEAFLRLRFRTLDSLSREDIRLEGEIATVCIQEGGGSEAEELAQSFGL